MKELKNNKKNKILKKIFIKICRFFNFEIIDQANFHLPVSNKKADENLSTIGERSISIPMGELKITRPIKSLDIILRTCASVDMLTQSKKRLFEYEKSEYTLRTLNSIVKSLNFSKNIFKKIDLKLTIIDHNSNKEVQENMKSILSNQFFESKIINLEINNFKRNINKINEENKNVTDNQISNMSNIHQSLLLAKECKDLIYFVEDDYIHSVNAIMEMLLTYEKVSSLLNRELILCPADYPYLYTKVDNSKIFLGNQNHWRTVDQTLCTFLTSNEIVQKYWEKLTSMCKVEHYPFEKPLHEIYKKEYCLSPIPSLAMHCTNINSIYGLPPNFKWEKIWDENKFK